MPRCRIVCARAPLPRNEKPGAVSRPGFQHTCKGYLFVPESRVIVKIFFPTEFFSGELFFAAEEMALSNREPSPAARFSSPQPGAEKFPVNFLLFTGRHFFAPASVALPPGGAAAKSRSPDERLRHPGNVAPGLRKRNPGYGPTATRSGVAGTRTAALYEWHDKHHSGHSAQN